MLTNLFKIKTWSLIVAGGCGIALVAGCQTNHRHPPVASSSWQSGTPSLTTAPTYQPQVSSHDHGAADGHRHGTASASPLTTAPTYQPQASSHDHGAADGHRHADVLARTSSVVGLPYGGQRTCPVSDEELGSMGDPIPVAVKGQTVYVCCSGCVGKVKANPEKYLAKVREETGRGN